MNTALWIAQILLAIAFLMAGAMKAMQPKEKLGERMAWVEDFSAGQIRAIGILEFLGAAGLILPALTGILPILTPLAAVGLALTMIGAAIVHIKRGEMAMIVAPVILFLLSAFVAYGRFALVPF